MPKKIILFADGTWNKPEQKDRDRVSPSNVVKMARALEAYDSKKLEQRRFYDRGVGTEGGLLIKLAGGMTGVIKIEGLGRRFSGLYYITSTIHKLNTQGGYRTSFRFRRNAT